MVWNINSNDSVILRWFGKILMDQYFQKGTRYVSAA
jgi:hypothetical protein